MVCFISYYYSMDSIIAFFNHPFFIVVWWVSTVGLILGVLIKIIFRFFGITPIIVRLWKALSDRKIAVFASDKTYNDLRDTILDSNIFKEKQIEQIRENCLEKAKKHSLYLVDRSSFADKIYEIYSLRKDEQTAIIIYALPRVIPEETLKDIANRSNTVIVNAKGRLLNDLFTSLITTKYDS